MQRVRVLRVTALLLVLAVSASPTLAQRTTQNAVTQSDDAFGKAVGNERIGIYSTDEVRGFNPVEAGNVRIEGLYFDQQGQTSNRLVDSSTIRVGYAARGYPFPAPTGVVDLQLEKFEGKRLISLDVESDIEGNLNGSANFKLPIDGDKLGISFGQGFRISRIPHSRYGNFNSQGVSLRWTPKPGAELIAFGSLFHFARASVSPVIFPATPEIPDQIDRRTFLGQPWARGNFDTLTAGMIAKLPLGSRYRVEAGLFRSERDNKRQFADLLLGTRPDGSVGNRVVIADLGSSQGATSGEVRFSGTWRQGPLSHRVMATLRGRDQSRRFGGQQRIALGTSQMFAKDDRPRPVFVEGAKDLSAVRQFNVGLGYDMIWTGRASLSIGLQKADYRKTVDFADPAVPIAVTRDKPWLLNANGTIEITKGLTAYAGYVRGLEESAVAPDIAINRSEAPPAVRTSQKDLGLRAVLRPGLSLITGLFEIRKPYFNLDANGKFGALGTIRHRGAEVSVAGTIVPGLTVVAGALLLDPEISGAEVDAGRIGKRPVGSAKRRAIANLDWRSKGTSPWSFDIAFDSISSETANIANSFTGPPRETFNIGARYRFSARGAKFLVRGLLTNALNDFGWRVSSSGGFTFTQPRTISLGLSADI